MAVISEGRNGTSPCHKNERFDNSLLTRAPFWGEQSVPELKVWTPQYCSTMVLENRTSVGRGDVSLEQVNCEQGRWECSGSFSRREARATVLYAAVGAFFLPPASLPAHSGPSHVLCVLGGLPQTPMPSHRVRLQGPRTETPCLSATMLCSVFMSAATAFCLLSSFPAGHQLGRDGLPSVAEHRAPHPQRSLY